MSLVLRGGRIATEDGIVEDGWVTVAEDGIIASVGRGLPEAPATGDTEEIDLAGSWLVPGFVDIHCHGGGGASYTEVAPDRVEAAALAHRKHGTTTTMASLVSRPIPVLLEQVSALAELAADGLVAGIHLEGPFISAARCGAHDPAVLTPPDLQSVRKLLAAGAGQIRMVTLAPELDGAVDAVREFTEAGVIVALGHTDATEAQVRPAVDAGATVATHLFNGMRPLHHREPGPIGALLDDERVTVELICDLVHLHPTAVRLAARHAGTERTVLVTDAMAAAGVGDGVYEVGGLRVTVRDGVPTLDGAGSLAASTLTLDKAVRNFVSSCRMTMSEAVAAVSTRPARLLGLAGPGVKAPIGVIAPGAVADLVVIDEQLRANRVMHRGSWV
ncbi:MAG TPA: N-acetylglucosamine-6-phosphate deacetylase [Pseudonocardiaceae bacterium]|jgi:N-acetylglucosamine-6-phosphate deacetylase|nr:N-acetylglucosamine-6-phosphate deacetylase [Pseudonocardiaceae bacterium]